MLEKIEIGKTYLSSLGNRATVLFIGKWKVLARFDDDSEDSYYKNAIINEWSEIPTPKKRYWLWDAKDYSGKIFKTSSYVDDNGCTSNGELYFDKEKLIKKHENEWIEV